MLQWMIAQGEAVRLLHHAVFAMLVVEMSKGGDDGTKRLLAHSIVPSLQTHKQTKSTL